MKIINKTNGNVFNDCSDFVDSEEFNEFADKLNGSSNGDLTRLMLNDGDFLEQVREFYCEYVKHKFNSLGHPEELLEFIKDAVGINHNWDIQYDPEDLED